MAYLQLIFFGWGRQNNSNDFFFFAYPKCEMLLLSYGLRMPFIEVGIKNTTQIIFKKVFRVILVFYFWQKKILIGQTKSYTF